VNTAQRISERRRQLKLSQETLAFRIGTSQTQISRYERGENDPTGDVLVKIADALDTTTDWLLGRTDYADRPLRGKGDLDDIETEIIQMLRHVDRNSRQKIVNVVKAMMAEV
jgi:transcriptional regulator with XRE-family HTH domain